MNPLIFALFFVSGACGLIYQVVWMRMMTHIFGTTVFAVSTVLAAFMTGLALGSYYLGKKSYAASNPLKRYAIYEFGIAAAALLVLVLLNLMAPLSVWLTNSLGASPVLFGVIRFILIFLLILVPTTLMGATLPILSQFVLTRPERIGRMLGSLYATNTLGAVAGCLLAGFYLIGSIGIHQSIYLAAFLNFAVGVVSWWLGRKTEANRPQAPADPVKAAARPPKKATPSKPSTPLQKRLEILLLVGFAVSGLTSFAYEVLWARSLIYVLGNSTYAFTIMLATFLIGIALGGYGSRLFVDRLKNPLRFFAWVQLGIGLSAASAMPLLEWVLSIPATREWFGAVEAAWGSVLLMRFVASFVVMLLPTLLVGMTFPLAGKILVRNLDHTGADVGRVYAVNTVGNIFGALLPAFLLIPLLGVYQGIWMMAVLNVGIALILLVYGRPGRSIFRHLAPASLLVLGVAVVALPYSRQFPSNTQETGDSVLFYKEGIAATTKVIEKRLTGYKHISVDGIQIGGSNPELDYKQQWLAHLPKLLLEDYTTELSVGLGSGILMGESARHEKLEKIICVEIAPSVVEGAAFFPEESYGVLDSPKAEVVVKDAVNYLLTSRNRYDIISTDGKTQPEYGVNGVFFSEEYYSLMRDRLAPGGLVIQWIPIHYPPDIFKTVLNTFCRTFPRALIWYSESNCFLVGSNQPIALDAARIDAKLADPELPFDGLRKFGMTSAKSVLTQLVVAEDAVLAALSQEPGIPVNTIEKPIIEFYDLADYQVPEAQRKKQNLEFLTSIRAQGRVGELMRGMPEPVQTAYAAEGQYLVGQRLVLAGAKRAELERHFNKALELDPDNPHLRHHIYGHYLETGITLMEEGNLERAELYIRQAIGIWPHDPDARYRMGFIHMKRGRGEAALQEYEASLQLNPRRDPLRYSLADTYLLSKMAAEAIRHYRILVATRPEEVRALRGLGEALLLAGKTSEALVYCQKAYALSPDAPEVIDTYAWALFQNGRKEQAREIISRAESDDLSDQAMERRREQILGR